MNNKYILLRKLKKYKREDIIITNHAESQALSQALEMRVQIQLELP